MQQAIQKQEVNLAPVEPLLKTFRDRQFRHTDYTVDGLKELLDDVLLENKEVFREIANTTELTSNFIQGKQMWAPSYWGNGWKVVNVNRADPNKISSINIMQFYCTSQIKMLESSNPDLEPDERFLQKEYREDVRAAKAFWNTYEGKFYTAWFNQQEALHNIVSGTYIESVGYDHLTESGKAFREIFEQKQVRISDGGSTCFSCGHKGPYEDFAPENEEEPFHKCGKCGSTEILTPAKPEYEEYTSHSGYETVKVGSLYLRLVPIQSVRFDIKKRPEECSRLLERLVVPRRKLQYLLNIDIDGESPYDDEGLRSKESISRAGNTLGGYESVFSNSIYNTDDIIVDKLSVMPEDVAHIKLTRGYKAIDGTEIPDGILLSDICPADGMTILSVAQGRHIIGMFPSVHHSKEMATGVYHMRFESGIGRGSEDTVEVQKRFNRFDSQNVRYMESSATPARTYIKGSVDQEHVKKISYPNAVIPINREVAMALNTTNLIQSLQPGQVAGQLFSYTYDILNQYRQLTSHSTEFSGAFPGVNNETATGARYAKATSDSLYSPTLNIKAEVRCKTAKNSLYQGNKYFRGFSAYYSLGKTSNGRATGLFVSGEMLNPEITFVAVRNSEQPKTMYDRQTDFVNMMAVANQGGGYEVLKASNPKLIEALHKSFDIELENDSYESLNDICEARLENALIIQGQFLVYQKAMSYAGQGYFDLPIEALLEALDIPIIVEEGEHIHKAKWFMSMLNSYEGMVMKAEERNILALFVRTHFQMEVAYQSAISSGFTQVMDQGNQPARQDEANRAEQQKQAELEKLRVKSEIDKQRDEAQFERKKEDNEHKANLKKEQSILESSLRKQENKEKDPKPKRKNIDDYE